MPHMVKKTDKQTEKILLELRRGAIALAVLSRLIQEHYGYSLRQDLDDCGFEINEGTLYPLLRRLEKQGLLQSRWDVSDSRPRRYYRISAQGRQSLLDLKAEWKYLGQVMDRVFAGADLEE